MLHIDINEYRHKSGSAPIFSNLNVDFQFGKLNVLLGLSGSGKTTLLRILVSLYHGELTGQVLYNSSDGSFTAMQLRTSAELGILSQHPSLLPWLSVSENILIPSKLNTNLKVPHKEKISRMLYGIGLSEAILTRYPHELSGGMQQRVVIARTLLYNPKYIFLDEAFTGLDVYTADKIAKMVSKYVESTNGFCLLTTHDIDNAIRYAENIYYLSRQGTLSQLPRDTTEEHIISMYRDDYNSEKNRLQI